MLTARTLVVTELRALGVARGAGCVNETGDIFLVRFGERHWILRPVRSGASREFSPSPSITQISQDLRSYPGSFSPLPTPMPVSLPRN